MSRTGMLHQAWLAKAVPSFFWKSNRFVEHV